GKIKKMNCLEEKRKEKKIDRNELARQTNVSVQTIQRIEENKYEPSFALASLLAKILDQEVTEIFLEE
ncbi:helix-turn-helix transcriptional regulator, partial [Enterococcus sp. AZ126]|uniref:helix-turn-helix transcriptional regulator n=1 Tax=Enterococcus sp. AZ126 TaxID=2774635 RepID=UPI003F225BBD